MKIFLTTVFHSNKLYYNLLYFIFRDPTVVVVRMGSLVMVPLAKILMNVSIIMVAVIKMLSVLTAMDLSK